MPGTRVLVIAQDPLVRGGLSRTIADGPGFQAIGSMSGDQFSAEDVDLFKPDILLWDTGWDSADTQDTLKEFQDLAIPLVVLVSNLQNASIIWSPNLRGMIFRDAPSNKLLAAMTAVTQGISAFDPDISAQWFTNRFQNSTVLVEDLTDREAEVLSLLAEGMPNKAIARQLGISDHTVKFHVNAIMGKLGAQSRTDAVVRATRLGIIRL
jgi:two-component system, NarL family, nitrate/nitrite response regulator NarL